MEGDLIAKLFPIIGNEASRAANNSLDLRENASKVVKVKDSPVFPDRGSRESTASAEGEEQRNDDNNNNNDEDDDDRIELRFSQPPKTGARYLLGSDRNRCDVVVTTTNKVSNEHCYLTFDDQRRVILVDCSMHGTKVMYESQENVTYQDAKSRRTYKDAKPRRNGTWIVGGDGALESFGTIVIELHKLIKFRIEVSVPGQKFLANVNSLVANGQGNETPSLGGLEALGIQSTVTTAAPSGANSPGDSPLFLEIEHLGAGSFGRVYRVYDAHTGFQYACKESHNPEDTISWQREINMMRSLEHDHIVRLQPFHSESTSSIRCLKLYMDYVPGGNLSKLGALSQVEVLRLLTQLSSALVYLHGRHPPLVHRDIKPDNILIQARNPLRVKLGDFGLAKDSEDLNTRCGSRPYLAPEIGFRDSYGPFTPPPYTKAVDIWSLGVVMLRYAGQGSMPKCYNYDNSYWYQVIEHVIHQPDSAVMNIIQHMVVYDANMRISAAACHERAVALGNSAPQMVCPASENYESVLTGNADPFAGLPPITSTIIGPTEISRVCSDVHRAIWNQEVNGGPSHGLYGALATSSTVRPAASPSPTNLDDETLRAAPPTEAKETNNSPRRSARLQAKDKATAHPVATKVLSGRIEQQRTPRRISSSNDPVSARTVEYQRASAEPSQRSFSDFASQSNGRPVTYPSSLDDVTKASGCSLPTVRGR